MHAAWSAGEIRKAMAIQSRLVPLHDAMFAESNPGPVKYAASLLGYGTAFCRLPLAPIADTNAEKMRAALRGLGLLD